MLSTLARIRTATAGAAALALATFVVLAGTPAPASAAAPQATQAVDMTVDEILARYYEVMGGLDALRSIDSMRMSGTLTLGEGMEAAFVNTSVRPNKNRMEFVIQGMTGIQAYDGENAWMFMPFMGQQAPEPMPAELAASVVRQADIDGPLVGYADKGHTIEVVGMADVEGTEAIELKVTMADGHVQRYYLDAEYFVPLKVVSMETMGGVEFEQSQLMSDYKEVGGLLMPHSIQIVTPQGTQSLIADKIEINVAIDESIFAMPASAEQQDAQRP